MSKADRYEHLLDIIQKATMELLELGSSGGQPGEEVTASSGRHLAVYKAHDYAQFWRALDVGAPIVMRHFTPTTAHLGSYVMMAESPDEFVIIVRARKRAFGNAIDTVRERYPDFAFSVDDRGLLIGRWMRDGFECTTSVHLRDHEHYVFHGREVSGAEVRADAEEMLAMGVLFQDLRRGERTAQ